MTILTTDRDNANLDIAAENRGGIEYPLNHLLSAAGTKIDPATDGALATLNTTAGGLLTNAQLRAAAVPVSGTFWPGTQPVSGTFWQATQPVSGTFWQATQPVSVAALPLPTGAATETTLAGVNAKLPTLSGGRIPVELPAGGAGLTDSELRANAVPVSAASLPLPTGAATETTLAGVNAKLPALSGGRIPVELPAGGSGLTDSELRAQAVQVIDPDAADLLRHLLKMLIAPLGYDKSLGRHRNTVVLESGTLNTLTTLTTLTNIFGIGGYAAQMTVLDQNRSAWAQCVRARIT